MKYGLYALRSFRLSRRFPGIISLVFSEFWLVARNPYELVHDRVGFSSKKKFPEDWENGLKMGQKQSFLNLFKKFVINFY